MSVSVIANALGEVADYFEKLPELATQAAALAINTVSQREALPMIRREMRDQLDFPEGYLESKDRLSVVRKATRNTLSATIRGRDRATSLARFRIGGQNPANTRGRGVRLQVKRGQTRVLRKAFLINLRGGNTGLAVRLKPGESLKNSSGAVELANNVYLLYGPSVDQVFQTVSGDVAPNVLDSVTNEFLRQLARLSSG